MGKRQHEWSYKQQDSEIQVGPVTESQFVGLIKDGTIRGTTLVRSPTRTKNEWVSAERIPAVAKFIQPPKEQPTVDSPNEPTPINKPQRSAAGKAKENVLNSGGPPRPQGQPEAAEGNHKRFRPLKSNTVTWLLRASMLALAINGLFVFCFILWGRTKLPSIASAQIGVFVIQLFLVIATAIFFLRWKYRAYANLQAVCVKPLKTSAGWCVAVYFIPLLNAFRPAMAMHEIQSRSKAGIGVVVLVWWILMILGGILERISWSAPGNDNKAGHVVSFVAICLTIAAGYQLLKIISTVTEKQRRYRFSLERNSNGI